MYKILAINDEQDFCQCCGKTNLKRVVWMENLDTGSIAHYGTTCAAHHSKLSSKEIKEGVAKNKRQAIIEYYASAERKALDEAIKRANDLKLHYGPERKAVIEEYRIAAYNKKIEIGVKYHVLPGGII